MIDALLHKLDQPALMGEAHRVVANTVDGKGGLFVMFGGRRAPVSPSPRRSRTTRASPVAKERPPADR